MSLSALLPWRQRTAKPPTAVLLFRGSMSPSAAEFSHLAARGVIAIPGETAGARGQWTLELAHAGWGDATLRCVGDLPLPAPGLIEMQPNLDDTDRQELSSAGNSLVITLTDPPADLLVARKRLLQFSWAVLGDDGVGLMDVLAQQAWSRTALAEECAHDAPVDVSALFSQHAVQMGDRGNESEDEDDEAPLWLHTHGLGDLGAVDFDIVGAHPELLAGNGQDLIRATAYAVLDGDLVLGGEHELAHPGGTVRLVAAEAYDRGCRAADRRESADDDHRDHRGVLCAPAGWWARLTGGGPRPAGFLQQTLDDSTVMGFSSAASELMAERARGTWPVFLALRTEFAALEFPTLVKLGFPTDDDPEDHEHLWFQVHGADAEGIDGTCVNSPLRVAALSEGKRGRHQLALLTEWRIMTPIGEITPHRQSAARIIRAHLPEFTAAMRAMNAAGPG